LKTTYAVSVCALAAIIAAGAPLAFAQGPGVSELREPITIASTNGLLDILMVARAAPVSTLPGAPIGWVYDICERPQDGSETCPQRNVQPLNLYGGTRLKLQKGDTLRIHLVNQLPPVHDSDHASDPGFEFLALNPTNLHTHGMLVSPHCPSAANPTYGDNVFVLTFNSANGKPEVSPHMHSAVRFDSTDYEIKIPDSHPSGLYWFHPHAHGISLNQISAGMSGIITVGDVSDYVCRDRLCSALVSQIRTRHMILKDTQVLPDGTIQTQEDPDFCPPQPGTGDPARQGSCDGQNDGEEGGPDYTGGKWFVTLSGQQYPSVTVNPALGEIWRLTNASGSASYRLQLWNPAQNRSMLFQILSLDGVSVSPDAGLSDEQKTALGGNKFKSEPCPGGFGPAANRGICTREMLMMPSSRAEVWVTYRDAQDRFALPPKGATAVFRTEGFQTGPSGDYWPQVDLAKVNFVQAPAALMPPVLDVHGEASSLASPLALAHSMAASNQTVAPDASCKALPPGHMRRIFYAVPTSNLDAFGLAYEEIDENGNVVGTPATDVTPFDPMKPTICVPLGPNNAPVTERWQLVNVATEDHNFHLHQTKFRLLTNDEIAGTAPIKGLVLDNVPLPHADGTCGNNPPDDNSNPIADWRAGLCQAYPVTVEIPFTIAGDFVYHCHILEHEDGGMMARIRVRPTK